jgi:hypothetical protein
LHQSGIFTKTDRMKLLTPLLTLAALAATPALPAQTFEGKVTMKVTARSGPMELSYSVKGGRVRVDMGATGAMIIDRDQGQMMILIPQRSMYMVRPLPGAMAAPPTGSGPDHSDTSLQQTGVTETILGYVCTKYVVTYPGGSTELWLTDQLGTFMGFGSGMTGPGGGRPGAPSAWEQVLHGKNFFPMRVVSTGAETFKLEVTAVAKQPLDAALFDPPAGWQKFDMGAMMGGFGQH